MYADDLVMLAGDRLITDTVAKFNWESKVPFDQFDVRSIGNARKFLDSIKDTLDTPAVRGKALDLC
jgi:hypothetical protein